MIAVAAVNIGIATVVIGVIAEEMVGVVAVDVGVVVGGVVVLDTTLLEAEEVVVKTDNNLQLKFSEIKKLFSILVKC